MRAPTAVAVLLALAAAPAFAQTHTHEGEAAPALLFDVDPTGHTVAGEVSHYGFVLLNKAGYPQVHQDATFRLQQGDRILFESPDTHEYDGIFSFDYVFDRAGPYTATAEWKDTTASFQGVVARPTNLIQGATLDLNAPAEAVAGEAAEFDLAILDGAGALVPHSDVIVEAWTEGTVVLRTHLHTHEDRMAFSYAFPEAGAYELRFLSYIAFPTPETPDLAAFVTTHTVDVTNPPAPTPALGEPTNCLALPTIETNARNPTADPGHGAHNASAPTFNTTIDPQVLVGPDTAVRLSGIVLAGDTRAPVQHVNFATTVTGPRGIVFASDSLHEYDGHYELMLVPETLGAYEMTLTTTAKRLDLDATATQPFCVAPPVVPLNAGPLRIDLAGIEDLVAGVPAELDLTVKNAAGVAVDHSEVEVSIARASDGVPWIDFKLHGHAGRMTATVAFPEGDHELRLSGITLSPTPTTLPGATFTATVAPGELPPDLPDLVPAADTANIPAAAATLAALAAAAAALTRRR